MKKECTKIPTFAGWDLALLSVTDSVECILGFKPSMIHMKQEDADWTLSKLEAGELAPSAQELTAMAANREVKIRLAYGPGQKAHYNSSTNG